MHFGNNSFYAFFDFLHLSPAPQDWFPSQLPGHGTVRLHRLQAAGDPNSARTSHGSMFCLRRRMPLTNVTSVCVRQEINSFLYAAVAATVGVGFELLPFLPFPFPWLLSEGGRRRVGCRGNIPGRAGPRLFILPLPALVWQCAGSSLFATALDRGRRMYSPTGFPALFPSGQRQTWMETKCRDLLAMVPIRSRFSKRVYYTVDK